MDVWHPWVPPSAHAEDTRTLLFPVTDPAGLSVLLHFNAVHDFAAVEVDGKVPAVLETGARRKIEFMAAGLEKAEGSTYMVKIPRWMDLSERELTLWGGSMFNTISLRNEHNRPFAGFGDKLGDGSRLLRSLLG
jgi:hypothetical protein